MGDTNPVHWSFWVIAAVTMLFNLAGVINFVMQLNPENVAAMHEAYRAVIETRPLWATVGFALAVFGGALGCALLLVKKAVAFYVFIASCLGALITLLHAFGITTDASPMDIIMGNVMQLVVTLFLIWYAKVSISKGWIN